MHGCCTLIYDRSVVVIIELYHSCRDFLSAMPVQQCILCLCTDAVRSHKLHVCSCGRTFAFGAGRGDTSQEVDNTG